MTDEGIYPKVAGDKLYVSEVNKYMQVLGHGSTTIVGNNTRQAAFNFSTPEELGNGCIILNYTFNGGDASQTFYAGATSVAASIQMTVADANGFCTLKIMQSPSTTGEYVYLREADEIVGVMVTSSALDFSAAETIYINLNTATGSTCYIRWIAYLVRGL